MSSPWSRWSFSVRAAPSFKRVSRENPDRNTQRPREHLSCLLLIYYQDTADNDSHQLSDLHQTVSETLNLSVLSCRLRNIWTNRELLRQPTTSKPKLAVTSCHSVRLNVESGSPWKHTHALSGPRLTAETSSGGTCSLQLLSYRWTTSAQTGLRPSFHSTCSCLTAAHSHSDCSSEIFTSSTDSES